MRVATVTSKGQVTIPAQVRKELGIEEGDRLAFEVADGEARVRVMKRVRLSQLLGALPATRPYPGKEAVREEVGRDLGASLAEWQS